MAQQVLLVEDHPFVRSAMTAVLSCAGFTVMAVDGEQAAAERLRDTVAPTLLVTDIHLGTGCGWRLARTARAIHPGLPILYMSAEAEREFDREGVPDALFVSKPFGVAAIAGALAQLGFGGNIAPDPAAPIAA